MVWRRIELHAEPGVVNMWLRARRILLLLLVADIALTVVMLAVAAFFIS